MQRPFFLSGCEQYGMAAMMDLMMHKYKPLRKNKNPYCSPAVRRNDNFLHKVLSDIFADRCSSIKEVESLVRENSNTLIDLLLSKITDFQSILPQGRSKLSLLWMAVLAGYQRTAELLLRSGSDANELCKTSFVQSCPSEFLLGASILEVLLDCMSPSEWNDNFIQHIVCRGANLNLRNRSGETLLHIAVKRERINMVELFLDKELNVNARSENGATPLHLAVMTKSAANEMVALLLKRGADLQARDNNGRNVLHLMTEVPWENVQLARKLIELGASINTKTHSRSLLPMHYAIILEKPKYVRLFAKYTEDIDKEIAEHGVTPVLFAVLWSLDAKVLQALVDAGADVNAVTEFGDSALDIAIKKWPVRKAHIKVLALKESCMPQPWQVRYRRVEEFMYGYLHFTEHYESGLSYFKRCMQYLAHLKTIKMNVKKCDVIKSDFSLFDILASCSCRTGQYCRYIAFQKRFETINHPTLSEMYCNNLLYAFQDAMQYHLLMKSNETMLGEVFNGVIPYIALRWVATHLTNLDHDCKLSR